MNRKEYIFIAAAFLLASCAKAPVVSGRLAREIAFSVAKAQVSTKAGDAPSDFPVDQHFGVTAWLNTDMTTGAQLTPTSTGNISQIRRSSTILTDGREFRPFTGPQGTMPASISSAMRPGRRLRNSASTPRTAILPQRLSGTRTRTCFTQIRSLPAPHPAVSPYLSSTYSPNLSSARS